MQATVWHFLDAFAKTKRHKCEKNGWKTPFLWKKVLKLLITFCCGKLERIKVFPEL